MVSRFQLVYQRQDEHELRVYDKKGLTFKLIRMPLDKKSNQSR